jgi:hypothetical protein
MSRMFKIQKGFTDQRDAMFDIYIDLDSITVIGNGWLHMRDDKEPWKISDECQRRILAQLHIVAEEKNG